MAKRETCPVDKQKDIESGPINITHATKTENAVVEKTFNLEDFIKGLRKEDLEKIQQRFLIDTSQEEFEQIKKIKKNNKCCIVGFAMSWKDAPYDEKGIDFWGINELYRYLQKHDIKTPFAAWFEIHNIKESPSKQDPIHQGFLKSCKIPLVTQKHWEEYPSSIPYPRHYIKKYFNRNFVEDEKNTGFSDYSNQISWMIALAIAMGYEEVMVYGVDMAQESEYAFQRASCQFFLGYALGAGIKVRIPKACELLKAGADYGFKTDNKNRFRKKDRIKGCEDSAYQLNIRNAEIDYYKDFLKDKLDQDTMLIEAEYESIKKDYQELDIQKKSADDILAFMSTMPSDMKEIEKRKGNVIQACTSNIDKSGKAFKKLDKKLKTLDKKKQKLKADCFINTKVLNDEQEINKSSLKSLRGIINECKHDLNNNLV